MARTALGIALAASLLPLIQARPVSAQPLAEPPVAQQPQPGTDQIIVRGGEADSPQASAVQRQARALTRAAMVRELPLARFQAPLCPGVTGLPVDYAAMIVSRLRATAQRANIRLAQEEECTANLILAFARDGKAEVEALAASNTGPLSRLSVAERREVLREAGPVRAWSITTTRTRDGMDLRGRPEEGQVPLAWTQSANSLILLRTRQDIDISVVLIDLPATEGMSLVQLADYGAMRGLVQTRPPQGSTRYDTILSLFQSGPHDAPAELTTFDIALLRSAYSPIANLPAFVKLAGVTREMRRERAAEQQAASGAEAE